jgi:dienelactone hydrolase
MRAKGSLNFGLLLAATIPFHNHALAAIPPSAPTPGDKMLAEYFKTETAALEARCLADIKTLDDWNAKKAGYRHQLFEMLSLSPLPARSDLKPVVTGRIEHELFNVENLHFQSMPGLYVTANLYLPKKLTKPAPAILYVCGHARVATDGVSYGNKTAYQHHGAWFARNGYVCLVIDTIQLGEIEGIHHGTYREGMWWWNARGYNSSGVEAWNCIRSLDYLQSRPEVDPNRLGVTGRSGGGAYSWWVAALDDRIKVAAPVAGITDLHNHVVDGTVEGHCDCMFTVNTYRWDYAQVAALVAPRPLLIANSDKDSIFPLDGVNRIHEKVHRIYALHKAGDKLGLLITEGPHKDTQDLQLPVFRWFNRHLKGEDPIIEMAATNFFTPQQLRVFEKIPADQRSSKIHETFVPQAAEPRVPSSRDEWAQQRKLWETALQQKVFAGWPNEPGPLQLEPNGTVAFSHSGEAAQLHAYDFTSEHDVRLRFYVVQPAAPLPGNLTISFQALDAQGWAEWWQLMLPILSPMTQGQGLVLDLPPSDMASLAAQRERIGQFVRKLRENHSIGVFFAPRGLGLTPWDQNERKQVQIRRRFMLLGQTLEGMRVWDIRRAIQAVRTVEGLGNKPITLSGRKELGVDVLYAALFEKDIYALELSETPLSHRAGPDYLNVLRVLDLPQAVAMAAEHTRVRLTQPESGDWKYPAAVRAALGLPKQQFEMR